MLRAGFCKLENSPDDGRHVANGARETAKRKRGGADEEGSANDERSFASAALYEK